MTTNKSILLCFLGSMVFQIYVLNQFLFSGWVNPYYYIIFILFLPAKKNHLFVILSAFLIGICIDIGSGTLNSIGPIHGFGSLCLGYFRHKYIRLISIRGNNLNDFNFYTLDVYRIFFYLSITTLFHHALLFFFSGHSFVNILISTICSSFFTILLLICSYYIFKK